MSDAAVRDLAQHAGIAVEWEDYAGKRRRVSAAVLRRILAALGLPCDKADELRHSREAVRASAGTRASALVTASVEEAIVFDESIDPDAAIAALDAVTFDEVREVAAGVADKLAIACVGPQSADEF